MSARHSGSHCRANLILHTSVCVRWDENGASECQLGPGHGADSCRDFRVATGFNSFQIWSFVTAFWRCYVSEVQMVLVRLQLLQTRAQHFLSASGQRTFLGLIDLRRVLK